MSTLQDIVDEYTAELTAALQKSEAEIRAALLGCHPEFSGEDIVPHLPSLVLQPGGKVKEDDGHDKKDHASKKDDAADDAAPKTKKGK